MSDLTTVCTVLSTYAVDGDEDDVGEEHGKANRNGREVRRDGIFGVWEGRK